MASRSRVSEEIQAGIYLEDLPSRRQEDDDGASSSSMKNFSRPFSSRSHIVPIHDPEGSNIEIPKASVPPRFRVTDSSSTLYAGTNPSEFGASSYGYTRSTRSGRSRRQSIEEENDRRAALDAWQTTRPRSTLGFTPSQLPDMSSAQGLSPGQIKELDWINRHEKRKQKDVPLLYRRHEMVIEEPPDGGCLAWAHAVCGFILTMNTQGLNMAFGVFQSYYERSLLQNDSHSKIAWIGSFQIFATFFMAIVTAPLTSRGYFRACFTGGSFLQFLSLMLVSACTKWWQIFLLQGVLSGVGMGLVFHSGIVLITTYFTTRLGTATAIAASGSSVGGIVFPLLASHTLPHLGFGWTMRIIAFVNLFTMVPVNVIVRERAGPPSPTKYAINWSILASLPFALMAVGMFFAFWGIYFGFYFIVAFGQDILHMTSIKSVSLLVAMNASNFVGRFIPNIISDACIGPMNTLIPASVLSSIFIFTWVGANTETALYIVACFYGFFSAGIQSLYVTTIFSFSGTDRKKLSLRMALVFVLISLASLTGAPLGGHLVTTNDGKYLTAQLFAGVNIALGALFFLLARLAKQGCAAMRV
ncbi:hypothetical protein DTO164E3_2419 [Paecilomyces variotii]|nr:hypothetical protein DTO164E3_2419 [Paecilomyces variotii]KAJ9206838.1 hypothetical protein DTO032I3_1426 [Paecilomyces variotii]KAJ9281351.1 hypothetical protein DTO021D3_1574 [Paecilomyces variotii]KAJ9290368.1 hypothetical protein DTO021C3_1992 [Paecilomyces variotii]KAJ9346610.1 hypothetical protein DTO027B6_864 [Paecilomyces variotii]